MHDYDTVAAMNRSECPFVCAVFLVCLPIPDVRFAGQNINFRCICMINFKIERNNTVATYRVYHRICRSIVTFCICVAINPCIFFASRLKVSRTRLQVEAEYLVCFFNGTYHKSFFIYTVGVCCICSTFKIVAALEVHVN